MKKTSDLRKLFLGGLILVIVGIGFVGCEKENIIPNKENGEEYSSNNKNINEEEVEEKAKSHGEIACIIRQGDGDAAWGTRCGTPTGKCGKKETPCKAVAILEPKLLPIGMGEREFIETWNNESSRKKLISLGYYSVDKN